MPRDVYSRRYLRRTRLGLAGIRTGTGRRRADSPDAEVGEVLGGVLNKRSHDGVLVETNEEDLVHPFDLGQGLDVVPDHGAAGDWEERLAVA